MNKLGIVINKTLTCLFTLLMPLLLAHRLKKNLKMFIIVHPSWFIRTLLGVTRPFIRSHCCTLHLGDTLKCRPHIKQDRMYITGINNFIKCTHCTPNLY